MNFTLRRVANPHISLNQSPIPSSDWVRYLGLYFDKRLTWKYHTTVKRTETNRRYKLLWRLLGRNSKISTANKLTIYKTILRQAWSYGIELWGSARPTNIKKFQVLQSKVLRTIVDAPYYASNLTLHTDLNIPFVCDLSRARYRSFHSSLNPHPNPLVQALASNTLPNDPPRRLKRKLLRDLL